MRGKSKNPLPGWRAFSLAYVAYVLCFYFAGRGDATVSHVVRGWCAAWPPLRWLLAAALLWLTAHLCWKGFP
jgi:hypothetical protein